MTTPEIKEKLIRKIRTTSDSNLLEEIARLIELEQDGLEIYSLSKEQLSTVKEAQAEYKRGGFLTGEQADKEAKEWLEK